METLSDTQFLEIQSYSEHPEVYRMADLIVDSYLKGKARCHRQKYILPARKLVASLWGHPSNYFRFSSSAEHYGAKRKQVWMSHQVLTLFLHMRDMDPPMFNLVQRAIPPALARDGKGRAAIYYRSWFFDNTLRDLTSLDIVPDPDLPRITLMNDEDVLLLIPREEREASWYQETDKTLRDHSEMLCKANITLADGSPMSPKDWHYYRRFRGSLRVTGRLYSGFVNYPKQERLGIKFNGVPALSIDFTALHPLLLLRIFHGLDHEPAGLLTTLADPYDMPWYPSLPRTVHKRLINALLNAKTRDSGIRALLNAYYRYDAVKNEIQVEIYDRKKKRQGVKVFKGNKPEIERYIEIFCMQHPMFRDYLFRGAGNALQYLDSEVMLFLMKISVATGVPILPVHDEIVFPEPYLDDMKYCLAGSWRLVLQGAGSFGNLPIKVRVGRIAAPQEIVGSIDLS
jgi:hypothetical protein